MNITDITKAAGRGKRRRRVGHGRGSGAGKTSGRGNKGAGQRSGPRRSVMQEGGQMPTFRRLPKRGFNNAQFATRYSIVNVATLEAKYPADAHVTRESLVELNVIRNKHLPVKILGTGELTKKLTVDAAKFSETAKKKIEAAGGTANVA